MPASRTSRRPRSLRLPRRVPGTSQTAMSLETTAMLVAIGLIVLILTVNAVGADFLIASLGGEAFARPMRCGNAVCNLRESSLSCPADCACAQTGSAAKNWLGGAACCPGQGPSNGVCCPLGTVWDGATCATRVARDGVRIECTSDLRARGAQGWVTCPAVYAPVCTFNADGRKLATLPSDCQACVDNSVAYYIRGECPS